MSEAKPGLAQMQDDFYIGWEDKAPPGLARRVRASVVLLLLLALGLCALLAAGQRTIGVSVFEWGTIKTFSGILRSQPYPHLVVSRPGARKGQVGYSSYYLVNPFKFGFDPEAAARCDGRAVSLKGTLVYRENQTMIEVVRGSVRPLGDSGQAATGTRSAAAPVRLGPQTFRGEIVDSKCFLGVMNPGALTPHRACAIRCLSGGIPPVLLVRRPDGTALYFLLVSRDGRAVNKEVLGLVAEPVEIRGEVECLGEMLVLRADPSTYRRVGGNAPTPASPSPLAARGSP